ncbi:hypothetical protein O6H91_06G070600 [Diphasiastrum complanatum]|uniref:Uncharacterized protein n=1 Tax=Diphasiastrum complanatum TaxID=34168 RepID=A0ACC2DFA9_DIPCM|nr:hypothetical protein O6H91_06G070600 [Diphasiastrum complanatum]
MNGTQAMVAVLFSCNGPNGMNFPISIISFGSAPLYSTVTSWINHAGWGGVCGGVANDPPCNVLNFPLYRIDCPSNSVFVGLPAIPNGALANYSLDLFRIQECFNLPL